MPSKLKIKGLRNKKATSAATAPKTPAPKALEAAAPVEILSWWLEPLVPLTIGRNVSSLDSGNSEGRQMTMVLNCIVLLMISVD